MSDFNTGDHLRLHRLKRLETSRYNIRMSEVNGHPSKTFSDHRRMNKMITFSRRYHVQRSSTLDASRRDATRPRTSKRLSRLCPALFSVFQRFSTANVSALAGPRHLSRPNSYLQ